MKNFILKNKKKTIIISLIVLSSFFVFLKDINKEIKTNTTKEQEKIIFKPEIEKENKKNNTQNISELTYKNDNKTEISVYDFMINLQKEGKISFKEKNYTGMGKFIEEINDIKPNDGKYWIYYVNNKKANIGVSNYKIKTGDVVSWKLESEY